MTPKRPDFKIGSIVGAPEPFADRFLVRNKISVDSNVYICWDKTVDKEVVLKAERFGSRRGSGLQKEIEIYSKLKTFPNFDIVLNSFGGIDHRFLILKKRGNDLKDYYLKRREVNEWSDSELYKYAVQMITGLKECHLKGIIHLDPKPNNYVLNENDDNRIHLIDFDCAKDYLDVNGKHIPFRKKLSFREILGNRIYLSLNSLRREEQSRRDDMLFLGYSLIWMARGNLPWANKPKCITTRRKHFKYLEEEKEKYFNSEQMKELCQYKWPLIYYMMYCSRLLFEEEPDYSYLISLFESNDGSVTEGYSL